jgi:hypothetical protein
MSRALAAVPPTLKTVIFRRATMPARVIVSLVLIAIVAGGFSVLAMQYFGIPLGILAVVAVLAALGLRVWTDKR